MSVRKIGTNSIIIAIGALGIVSSLVTSYWPSATTISIRILNSVIFVAIFVIMVLSKLWHKEYKEKLDLEAIKDELEAENMMLKNNSSYEVPFKCFNPRGNSTDILLIKNNTNFRNGTFVSIYNKTDSSEDLAYLGQILNIQTDNCYQVQVIKANIGYEDFEINMNTIKNFIVHPSIPSNFIGLLNND